MKNVVKLALVALAAFTLASCEKEPIGGTAVEPLAGQWYVQVDGFNTETNEVVIEDFNDGRIVLLTYNTAKNEPNKLYVDDRGGFWEFKVVVDCDVNNLTFGSAKEVENEAYPSNVTLTNGKIVKGGAKTPSGAKADYIQFDIKFDDDDLSAYGMPGVSYGDYYGFDVYRVHGWRYTGLVNDD